MITTVAPSDWRDLQQQVARILGECGFVVDIETTVSLPRGSVEIDVLGRESNQGRMNTIVCECKHWATPVPQTVVHAFRTVAAETGANTGYVVSRSGFQSGAFAAAESTNIELVTWEEFQERFEKTWLREYFFPTITESLDPLLTYAEPFTPKWFLRLSAADQSQYRELHRQYLPFAVLIMAKFSTYSRMINDEEPPPVLPIATWTPEVPEAEIPAAILQARGYRELLDASLSFGLDGIVAFRELRDRACAADPEPGCP
jgi:hypothetical protein